MSFYQENLSNDNTQRESIQLDKTTMGYKMVDFEGHINIIYVVEQNGYSECIKIATGVECKITKKGNEMGYIIRGGYILDKDILKSNLKYNIILSESNTTHYDLYKDPITNDPITNDMLDNIYKNIDYITDIIKNYKNILFICGDYPGYGGAATNCDKLQTHFSQYCNTYTIYYNFENDINKKITRNTRYRIIEEKNIKQVLKTLEFKPDMIILKNSVSVNIKSIYSCPVLFFVPGIYQNKLNKYYTELKTKEDHDQYINNTILTQIKNSDYAFSNSYHTQAILNTVYNMKTYIFYTTFVPYYRNKIEHNSNWDSRKYKYGIIMSDFKRTIKNMNKSLAFLKGKSDVLLVGANSSMYKKYGFKCIEYVDNKHIDLYYTQIKYLVQDSYFESCSNVKVEAVFNGCKIHTIKTRPVIKTHHAIVISSTQYPGYGGAATNAYELIKEFRRNNYNVCGVFFHNDLTINKDPDNIGGIFLYSYKYNENIVKFETIQYLKRAPTVCLAKNYLAPYYCKQIFKCHTTYLLSGINHFRLYYPGISAQGLLGDDFIVNEKFDEEIHTLSIVDDVVINSELTNNIFRKIYPEYTHKIKGVVDTTNKIKKLPLLEKTNDIIIVCSKLTRINKNNSFLINVLKNELFDKYNKIIVGQHYSKFIDIPNTQCYGLTNHTDTITAMNKSKILLFPSLFDSNSNTIREAYHHNCMPLITRNIGFSELYPDYLVCESYDEEEWVRKLLYLLTNYDDIKDTRINYSDTFSVDDLL